MSFVRELKRRNVFRVGIAYAAATWLLIQVADIVFPRLGLPDSAVSLVIALLAIGFIPALILAWAFELTPEGLKREEDVDRSESITPQTARKLDRVIMGIMAVVIAFLVLDRFAFTEDTQRATQATEAQTTTVGSDDKPAKNSGPSIAVLPFVNMSGDVDNEYFSDGLTETLLHMLAQLPELRVAARTSSFAFKGRDAGIVEIAKALNVAHILEGSVQKAGNRVRVTAQLIRADDGFHVWSQNYDRTLEDIFAIQDEIATDVAGALDKTLLDGGTSILRIETSNLRAYDTYLHAIEQQAIGSYGSLSSAESLFKQALGADPGFVDAKLGLARNYLMQANTGMIELTQMQQTIKPLLSQIREIQPNNSLARAIEILAELNPDTATSQDAFRQGVDELRSLLPLLPAETYIRGRTALMLAFAVEEPEMALDVLEAGLVFDPLSPTLYGQQGNVYIQMKQFENARDAYLKAIKLDPLDPNNYGRMAYLSAETDDVAGVFKWRLKQMEADPQDHENAAHIARDFYDFGIPEEGNRWMERVRALAPDSDILKRLLIDRAWAGGNSAEVIELAKSMIAKPASMRHDAFPTAVIVHRNYMSKAGRHREAYDFLVGVRPEIVSFDRLPEDIQGILIQWASIELMSGFASPAETRAAWAPFAENLRANGSWWLQDPYGEAVDLFFMGDIEAAIEKVREDLAQPLASWPTRSKQWEEDSIFAPITANPEVAARLSELKREKQEVREQIKEMLQSPEWNPQGLTRN